jgi:hypothetical protein
MSDGKNIQSMCKQVKLFGTHLFKFLKDLKTAFPATREVTHSVWNTYKDSDKEEYIANCVELITVHVKSIVEHDVGIVSDDYSGEVVLFPHFDLKEVWKIISASGATDGDIINIFEHIRSLYLLGNAALKQVDTFNKVMERQSELLKEILANAGLDEKVSARVDQLNKEEKEKEGNMLKNLLGVDISSDELMELFSDEDGNILLEIAEEIRSELDLSDKINVDEPVAAIRELMTNPDKLKALVHQLTDVIKRKFDNGELSLDRFKNSEKFMKIFDKVRPEMLKEKLASFGIDISNLDQDAEIIVQQMEIKQLHQKYTEIFPTLTKGQQRKIGKFPENHDPSTMSEDDKRQIQKIQTKLAKLTS